MNTSGDRLRGERIKLGLSQEAFAARGGVKKLAQINYEQGRRQPDAEYLRRIAEIGADVAYILTGQKLSAARETEGSYMIRANAEREAGVYGSAIAHRHAAGHNALNDVHPKERSMLTYDLLPGFEGVRLIGGLTDFLALVDVARDVAARSPLIRHKDDTPFLWLSYLARKAYEAPQDVIDVPDTGRLFWTAVGWPLLLVVSRVQRESLAYIDHPKGHQAVAYALEAVVESALKDAFAGASDKMFAVWRGIDAHDEALVERLGEVSERYLAWSPAQRAAHLADLFVPGWQSQS